MTGYTHSILLFFVVVLMAVGVATLGADLRGDGTLHVVNAAVGGGALALAVALALPVQVKNAIAELMPAVSALRKAA